jgi:hypothetical protein
MARVLGLLALAVASCGAFNVVRTDLLHVHWVYALCSVPCGCKCLCWSPAWFRLALTLDLALHHLGVCRLTRMPATPLLLGTVSPNGGRDEWQVCQCPGDGRAARGA